MDKILVILSSANHLELADGQRLETGFFLNELGVPAQQLVSAGFQLVLANPRGNRPAMDANSDDASFFGHDEERYQRTRAFVHELPDLDQPKSFAQILTEGLQDYAGVFVPGGHAPMADLLMDAQLGQILRHFHQHAKPTAMICHGPAAALSAQFDPIGFVAALKEGREVPAQDWIYANYSMTVFSNIEERLAELKMPARMQFHIESALKLAGAKIEVAWIPMQSKVVRDRELITGQNPASDAELAGQFLEMLGSRQTAGARPSR
ncbi:MAG: type 1 glutamine amidotransferase domain-containing protein [Candidatus Eremiobacteraeota bacterium]|nr:type 1 glutamine amidotransferase domain-containing protein [Candidatus Eremiobacteraeota bacterium]MCW5872289.1 type 1 glutamine amidotransferase domain-containing protein [Candidatus Eremiobacteraeota bacterium]